jgi:N-acetylglucosaminyl-diphospho-decaprenol L-rhamnosyltransferase
MTGPYGDLYQTAPTSTADVRQSEREDPLASYEVVIVNYMTRRHLARTLECLPDDVWVTVVDNSGREEPVDDLVRSRPRSRYLATLRNVGFARAANHGVAQTFSDAVVILNPACFPRPSVLDELGSEVTWDAGYAACGPAVVSESGRAQYGGGGWLPTLRRATVHALGAHKTKVLGREGIAASPRLSEPMEVEWLMGACLAVNRKAFETVGGFDDRFFLYNEDMGLGRRLRQAGFKQLLRADIAVPHIGGASSSSIRRLVWRIRAESMVAYLHAYNPRWEAYAIRGVLAAGYLGRAFGYALAGRRGRVAEMMHYAGRTLTAAARRERARGTDGRLMPTGSGP